MDRDGTPIHPDPQIAQSRRIKRMEPGYILYRDVYVDRVAGDPAAYLEERVCGVSPVCGCED
jgi:hypothetical protein